MQRRKGTHRTQQIQRGKRTRSNRSRTHRRTYRSTYRSTHHSKRIICNRAKRNRTKRTNGGDYTDATITERELVPIGPKGVVVAMPGYVFSAEEYVRHMENVDRNGSD